jgi:glycerol kinase
MSEEEHPRFVVGIDQSATATRAHQLFFDGEFQPMFSVEHNPIRPQPGWSEHDPKELLANLRQCFDYAQGADAVALANHGDTVIAWNAETGEPLCNAIDGKDRRGHAFVDRLNTDGAEALTRERAGRPLDPRFPAAKLRWILDHVPETKPLADKGRLRLGTSDAFFLDRLCGAYATDVTTASRTGLMNLATGQWDTDLCRVFGVPIELLPPIRPTVHEQGFVSGTRLPLVASMARRQAALFGHGCLAPGQVALSFESEAIALAIAGETPINTRTADFLPTVAWRIGARTSHAIEGGAHDAASALDWAKRLGLFSTFRDLRQIQGPSALERGLVFVPAPTGPTRSNPGQGTASLWIGMGLDTTRLELVQALLEGVALRSAIALKTMDEHVLLADVVSVNGALSLNPYFCEFLARALDRTVVVPSTPDVTGLGCAQFAFIGAGLGPIETLPPVSPPDRTVTPESPMPAEVIARFANAVDLCRHWRTP